MARESGGHEHVVEGRESTDQRVGIGRHLVQAGPVAGEAGLLEQGHAAYRKLERRSLPVQVDALVDAGALVAVGHPGEQACAFAMEVQPGREVDHEREVRRDLREWRGQHHLPT